MKINNSPRVGTTAWNKPMSTKGGDVDDASVWRAAAMLTLLRHLQIMLIDQDSRVTYAAKEDLAVADSEFSQMVICVFGDGVERDIDALVQAIEVCIDEPGEDIAELWAGGIARLTTVLMKATVKENGDWSYTDPNGLSLSFKAVEQFMRTNDESGDALMALANIN